MLQIKRQFEEYKAAQKPKPASRSGKVITMPVPAVSGLLPMNYEKTKRSVAPD